MSETDPPFGTDPFCAGEVRLVVHFQGTTIKRTGRCSRPRHLGAPCTTRLALLTVFGHRIEVEVEWEPNAGPQPEKAEPTDAPPSRPGTWSPPAAPCPGA